MFTKYVTINEAIRKITQLVRGTLLTKIDIRNAFRLLQYILQIDTCYVGMQWNGGVYINTSLPFGLWLGPKLFNILAEFLTWLLSRVVYYYLTLVDFELYFFTTAVLVIH